MQQVDELKTADKGDGLKNGGSADASKVTFMPEQQARVQELIDDAYRKAYAKASKTRSSSDDVERLKSEIEALRQDRLMAQLYKAISKYNVVDTEEVAKLISDRVRMDEKGNITVVNDSGSARINGSGHPMGMDEYLSYWLSKRPHHLRSTGATGGGSQGALFGRKGYPIKGGCHMRKITALLILCFLVFAGCESLSVTRSILFPSYEDKNIPNNPQIFHGSFDTVWNAALDSLDELGFVIAQMKKEDGYITTQEKEVPEKIYARGNEEFSTVIKERVKVSIRLSQSDDSVKVTVNSYVERLLKDNMTPKMKYWAERTSNGLLESRIKNKIAAKLHLKEENGSR